MINRIEANEPRPLSRKEMVEALAQVSYDENPVKWPLALTRKYYSSHTDEEISKEYEDTFGG